MFDIKVKTLFVKKIILIGTIQFLNIFKVWKNNLNTLQSKNKIKLEFKSLSVLSY